MHLYNSNDFNYIFAASTKELRKEWMRKIKNFCLFSEKKTFNIHSPRKDSGKRLTRSRSANKSQNPLIPPHDIPLASSINGKYCRLDVI